jgi:hypothetical protein
MRKFKESPRENYMSLYDQAQDLTTGYLIQEVIKTDLVKVAKAFLSELDSRIGSELTEDEYFNILDKCNPTY